MGFKYLKLILVCLLMSALFISSVFIGGHQNNEVKKLSAERDVDKRLETVISKPVEIIDRNLARKFESTEVCFSFSSEVAKAQQFWKVNRFPKGNELIELGYSIDEVTLAIEHFRLGMWSYIWRTSYIKKRSQSSMKNKSLRQQAELLIGYALPQNLSVRFDYPQAFFKDYSLKNQEERTKLLESNEPTVDDLAAIIKKGELSEPKLLVILDHIDSPGDLLGEDSNYLSLLDLTARVGYSSLVNELITRGVSQSKDWYLASTLEYAFEGLYSVLRAGGDLQTRVNIVKKLIEEGGVASMKLNDEFGAKSTESTVYFEFSKGDLDRLVYDFNLDLLSVQPKEKPDTDVIKQSIVEHFETEQKEYLVSELPDYTDYDKKCSVFQDVIEERKLNDYLAKLRESGFCLDEKNRIAMCNTEDSKIK